MSWKRDRLALVLAAGTLAWFTLVVELSNAPPTAVPYKRKKIVQSGDLMIGALLPVHEQSNYSENEQLAGGSKRKCGIIRDQYGVQRVEALLYMLDKLNDKNRTRILPGVKLGLEIRDECWETSIALEETIDFIKDTISSRDNDLYDPIANNAHGDNSSGLATFDPFINDQNILLEKCQVINKNKPSNQNRILAVIGPAGSSVSINVQNLLQLFDIPQIGYSATSRDLSDKKMFKTFMRVVPSDYLQVKAMVDVVQTMNWTYLFAIYTEGSYGQAGMEAFRNETSYLNVCLAMYEKIREYASNEDYENIIRRMNHTANARVIVCFCYGETVRGLLGAIRRLNLRGRFLILGRYTEIFIIFENLYLF
jgi:metabotropic glutamate receptor 1